MGEWTLGFDQKVTIKWLLTVPTWKTYVQEDHNEGARRVHVVCVCTGTGHSEEESKQPH